MAHQHLPPQPCPDLIAQDEMIEMLKYAAPNEGTPQRRNMSCGTKLGVNSTTTTAFIALLQAAKDLNEKFTSRAYEVFE